MDREMGIIAKLQVQVTDQRCCHHGSTLQEMRYEL